MKKTILTFDKYYHIYNHGNGSDNLFRSDSNYIQFLQKYAHYINPIAQTYAYCLMPNHFHVLLKIKDHKEIANSFEVLKNRKMLILEEMEEFITRQFSNFFNAYAKWYNQKYERKGSLFCVNFRRKEVGTEPYLKQLMHYIHFNPVHHNFVSDLRDWKYSSYQSFFSEKSTSLQREQVLDWFEDKSNFIAFHQQDIRGFEPQFD